MRFLTRVVLAAILASGASEPQFALSQDYEDGYEGPPSLHRGYRDYDPGVEPLRRVVASGLNCDAVIPGFLGPQPFSCPLPTPRPLGARCYCETLPAAFTEQQTVVGEVVP